MKNRIDYLEEVMENVIDMDLYLGYWGAVDNFGSIPSLSEFHFY